jgi:4'-phosphopantetheinyl transferase EntD
MAGPPEAVATLRFEKTPSEPSVPYDEAMPRPFLYLTPPAPDDLAPPALLEAALASLTDAERETCDAFKFPKRRRDWLLGRLAAKRAVQAAEGKDRELSAIAVLPLPSGCPVFTGAEGLAGWGLSISHGHGRAAAVVAPGPVGVDVEQLRALPEGGWRFFLNPKERAWLEDAPLGPQGEIVVWALKEAAYKALQGSVSGVLSLAVVAAEDGKATIAHAEGVLFARYARLGTAVLAVAAPAPVGDWLDDLAFPTE